MFSSPLFLVCPFSDTLASPMGAVGGIGSYPLQLICPRRFSCPAVLPEALESFKVTNQTFSNLRQIRGKSVCFYSQRNTLPNIQEGQEIVPPEAIGPLERVNIHRPHNSRSVD